MFSCFHVSSKNVVLSTKRQNATLSWSQTVFADSKLFGKQLQIRKAFNVCRPVRALTRAASKRKRLLTLKVLLTYYVIFYTYFVFEKEFGLAFIF